jgi:rhamnopyranosyl-N-acetylglucosaminyl-diphospho-decaprenol beta-1,3/1,4-galactofuranosyltransferase
MAPEQEEEPARRGPRVIAVVVTYRRDELLLGCIDAIAGQTRPPERTLVIDNGGVAREVLGGDRPGVTLIEPGENLGPAGGYALGFGEALAAEADAIWAVDDDVVPAPRCLERLVAARSAGAEVAVPLQRKPGGVRGFPPSWNGPLFDAGMVREVGVPRADLFFWAEDTEYVARLRANGHLRTHVREAEVLHLNPRARRRGQPRDWQLYYEVRNTLEYRLRIRRRTVKGVARALGSVLGKLASILLLERGKGRSLRLWWSGVRDYRRGRLGRVVDPADTR